MDVLNALEKQAKRLEGSIAACEVGGSYADVAILHDRLTHCIEVYADLVDSDYPVRHGSEKTAATTTPQFHCGDSVRIRDTADNAAGMFGRVVKVRELTCDVVIGVIEGAVAFEDLELVPSHRTEKR